MSNVAQYLPTAAAIREGTEAVRAGWSPETERSRHAVEVADPVTVLELRHDRHRRGTYRVEKGEPF